ncbi:SGNH/GDSL hydrolase family protein [Mucilaginibacter limnophilus]|uniref:SGNH/GDSL hydrolase family protein n=1 Tax=Mucilaginibacter limnophilus TaxID=1932778 RepID=A0A437MTV3_9SPHI|nr:SGNH/GDSL hydrolase family protein [Mucilaginibacter limnophilus]RVU01077.1 SGNH/GDSL hydrolase family protein [Mucilaginibacter limnophilus]
MTGTIDELKKFFYEKNETLSKEEVLAGFEQVTNSNKGPAIVTTNPATIGAIKVGDRWDVKPNTGPYTYFDNLSIPAKVGTQYVSQPYFIRNATAWEAKWLLVDAPVLTDYTQKTEFDPVKAQVDNLAALLDEAPLLLPSQDSSVTAERLVATYDGYINAAGYTASAQFKTFVYSLKDIYSLRIVASSTGSNTYIAAVYDSYTAFLPANRKELIKLSNSNTTPSTIDATYIVSNETYFLAICYKIDTGSAALSEWTSNILDKDILYKRNTNEVLNAEFTPLSIINNTYLGAAGGGFSLAGYHIYVYEVKAGDLYRIRGAAKGNSSRIYAFSTSSTPVSSAVVELGDATVNIAGGKFIDKLIKVPVGALYLHVTRDTLNTTDLSTVYKLSPMNTAIATNTFAIGKGNASYEAMTALNNKLAQQYPQQWINVNAGINNRYDFGNMKVSAPFTVPALYGSVDISVTNVSLITVGILICVGTKTNFDVYRVSAINGLVVTCALVQNNTGNIGVTLQVSASWVNSGLTSSDTLSVYTYVDILAYLSNEIPTSATFDNLHPTTAVYNIIGDIIASRINVMFGKPPRIIFNGDSFTAGTNAVYPTRISQTLGSTRVNLAIGGARIEHILDRFLTYMATYTPVAGDLFLFYMGTNNLIALDNEVADPQLMLYNNSYSSVFLDALERISAALPLGNWMVCSGHGYTYNYKEKSKL